MCGNIWLNARSTFAKGTKAELTLNNGVVMRTIKLPEEGGTFITKSYQPVNGEFNYFLPSSADFQFEVNGTIYSGNSNRSLAGNCCAPMILATASNYFGYKY